MNFRIGQKVVCVDGTRLCLDLGEQRPVKGRIYTIRNFCEDDTDGTGLRLEEIVNEPRHYTDGYAEIAFYVWRFRPVRTTDISIFTAMLTPIPHKEPAPQD